MNTSTTKPALMSQPNFNPQGRYSDSALRLTTARYAADIEARAARNPAYLTTTTLTSLNRAVKAASTALTKATTHLNLRRARARLFYATATRDAFVIVLRQTQPSAPALRLPDPTKASRKYRAPDTAGKLAAWRYEIRWRSRKLDSLKDTYQELRAQYERRRQTWEQARARLALALDDKEMELNLRRRVNPNARTSHKLADEIRGLREIVRTARRELREIEGDYHSLRNQRHKLRERIELLTARIQERETIC